MQTRIANALSHRLPRWRLASLVAAACASMALAAASTASPAKAPVATTYHVVPLAANSTPAGINSRGQVAFTEYVGTIPRARFYDGATVHDLGTFGGPDAFANALNDQGQVVGAAATSTDGIYHAFRWSRTAGLVDLNRPGAGYSVANDINNRGQVVGGARFVGTLPRFHAFRWSPHTGMVDLGALGPTSESVAFALNDAGIATGWSDEAAGPLLTQAVRWPYGSGPIPLNGFPSIASIGYDINNAGQIVGGAAFDTRLSDQAFFWTQAGGLQGLGTEPSYLSWAGQVNEKGLVIGTLYSSPVDRNGFIWSRDNGLLVVGTPGVADSDVTDVNNRGQVLGFQNGQGFIWTRNEGFVDLSSRVVGAPPELTQFVGLVLNDNGTIVAGTNANNLVLLVPQAAYHQAPVAGPVTFTGTARAHALLSFSAGFKDVDVRDTHKAFWSWGDGSKSVGTVSERGGTGSVSGQHAFRAAGIYTVRLTLVDSSGKSSTVERKLVVCGGAAASSGAGAFASPANAAAGPRRASIGSFAFLAEGADARRAAVEVNVAGMALRSSRVEQVTSMGAQVRYSGQGSVNGRGGYRFTLTATSGAATGGKDRIHVRIVHTELGSKVEIVDYDNGAGDGTPGAATQAKGVMPMGSMVLNGEIALGARQQ